MRNHASTPCSSQNAPIASTLVLAGPAQAQRRGVAERVTEMGQVVPVAVHEPAVASARAAAADVLLEHDHVDAGVERASVDQAVHSPV